MITNAYNTNMLLRHTDQKIQIVKRRHYRMIIAQRVDDSIEDLSSGIEVFYNTEAKFFSFDWKRRIKTS